MSDSRFIRPFPQTNADKMGLIVWLVTEGLPDIHDDEKECFYYAYTSLTGQTYEQAKNAFADAVQFGLIQADEEENG